MEKSGSDFAPKGGLDVDDSMSAVKDDVHCDVCFSTHDSCLIQIVIIQIMLFIQVMLLGMFGIICTCFISGNLRREGGSVGPLFDIHSGSAAQQSIPLPNGAHRDVFPRLHAF